MRRALRIAVVDFYHQSWRLAVLNAALCGFAVFVLLTGFFVQPVFALFVLLGPLAAALMHCAVTLAQTEDLRLAEALIGLRLHWRRGLALGLAVAAVAVGGVFAIPFYGSAGGFGWPLMMLAIYVLALFGILQLLLWPLAVFERERPLHDVAREAVAAFFRRPAAVTGLAFVLFLLNLAGAAAALAPLLTVTVAYSFLAAAHFALPRNPMREA